jgi:hypothetical protein
LPEMMCHIVVRGRKPAALSIKRQIEEQGPDTRLSQVQLPAQACPVVAAFKHLPADVVRSSIFTQWK